MSGFTIAILLVLLPCCAHNVQTDRRTSPSGGQRSFSAEDERVKAPVPMPQDVLSILEKDDFVRPQLEDNDPPRKKVSPSWFSTSQIHLSSSPKPDLLVMAVGPLRGANVTMFWLFRQKGAGHQLVLRTGCLDLELKGSRRNGYRDVECAAVVMQKASTILYRFDGKRYIQYTSKLEDIK